MTTTLHLTRHTVLTAAVARAWRRWRDRPQGLLPVGPQRAGPWAGAPGTDRDRDRVLSDLRAASTRR